MKLLKQPLEPFKQRLKTSLLWGSMVGLVFFICYPLTNWITLKQQNIWNLYFSQELLIPLVPQFIWLYLALYPLLILPIFLLNSRTIKKLSIQLIIATLLASVIFIIFPCHLGFERVLPQQTLYQSLFLFLFTIDYPHNLVPSLHVTYSSLIIFTINKQVTPILQLLLYCLLVAIICSTVFIHQHHLLDIFTGVVLSLIIYNTKGFGNEKNNHKLTTVNKHL